jgi:hypothetical protein
MSADHPNRMSGADAAARKTAAAKRAQAEERAEQLRDHIYGLALGAEREETQLTASVAWLDRHEGKPVQRVVARAADSLSEMSDEALRDELARLRGE